MASKAGSKKQKCKYWNKCFRKDDDHKTNFLHPGDDVSKDEDDVIGGNGTGTTDSTQKGPTVDLQGKKVVFVGSFNKTMEVAATGYGCIVKGQVSEDIDIVVAGDESGKKGEKAKKLGLRVVTEDYWTDLLSRSVKPSKAPKNKADAANAIDSDDESHGTDEKKKKMKRQRTHDLSDDDDGEGSSKRLTRSSSIKKTKLSDDSKRRKPDSDMDTSDENEEILKKAKKNAESDSEEMPSPKKKKTAAETGAKAVKPTKIAKCKYWDKCYRKEADHIKTFLHPSDDPSELMDPEDVGIKSLADGEEADVKVGTKSYRIKHTGDDYYCNCIGWKTQNKAVDKRTCTHLRQYLGDKFESKRIGVQFAAATANKGGEATIFRPQKHKSVSVLLAQKWVDQDPVGWWISEKLDGVRAYWDGKSFFSRLGNEFIPPPWFIENFPSDMTLDGELFGGRAKFQSTVSIVKNAGSARWKELEYHIFDAPSIGEKPFEKRIQTMKEYFEKNDSKTAVVVEHKKCRGRDHIKEELERVEKLGGEGLMIREPKSKYEQRRSYTLLKIKTFYDAEAKVIAYVPGKGSNTGRTGALRCVMECGKKFSVGSGLSDKERTRPPKIGSIITYKFQEYTNDGIPRFPSYIGIRIDIDGPKDAIMHEGKEFKKKA